MCIFCKIILKEIPSTCIYEDDLTYVFPDIHPKADTHLLFIPKKHIVNFSECNTNDELVIIHHIMTSINIVTKKLGIDDFKLICNSGVNSGQEIMHMHFHLLARNIK